MYHISRSGDIALCGAAPGNCPLKSSPHGTLEELEAGLENDYGLLSTQTRSWKLPESEPMREDWIPEERRFWIRVNEKLGLVIYQGIPYVPSDPSGSVYYCVHCHTRLPHSDEYRKTSWEVDCPGCGTICRDGLTGVSLKPGAERFFYEKEVFRSDWYHYTSYEDWESLGTRPSTDISVIHLGTEDAALDRRTHTGGKPGRLYRVRLKPGTELAEKILEEDPYNDEPSPRVQDGVTDKGILLSGATRYMNQYEDPGSMSLIVDPRCLEILEVAEKS